MSGWLLCVPPDHFTSFVHHSGRYVDVPNPPTELSTCVGALCFHLPSEGTELSFVVSTPYFRFSYNGELDVLGGRVVDVADGCSQPVK